jgi:hypothetical protein
MRYHAFSIDMDSENKEFVIIDRGIYTMKNLLEYAKFNVSEKTINSYVYQKKSLNVNVWHYNGIEEKFYIAFENKTRDLKKFLINKWENQKIYVAYTKDDSYVCHGKTFNVIADFLNVSISSVFQAYKNGRFNNFLKDYYVVSMKMSKFCKLI